MKTITDVVKLMGKERHESMEALTVAVYNKCTEFGILKTKIGREITPEIIDRVIRDSLSHIRLGKGKWKNWTFRRGEGFIKFYDNNSMDIITVNKHTLEDFEYVDAPKIKVLVKPIKEGVEAHEFYKTFDTLSQAEKFVDEEEFASEIFLAVGKLIIPIENESFK